MKLDWKQTKALSPLWMAARSPKPRSVMDDPSRDAPPPTISEMGERLLTEAALTALPIGRLLKPGLQALKYAGAPLAGAYSSDSEAGWTNVIPKLTRKRTEEYLAKHGLQATRDAAEDLGVVVMPSGQMLAPTPPVTKPPSYIKDLTQAGTSQDARLVPNLYGKGWVMEGEYPAGKYAETLNHELEHAQAVLEGRMAGTNPEAFESLRGLSPQLAEKAYRNVESEILADSAAQQLTHPWYRTSAVTTPLDEFTAVRPQYIQKGQHPAISTTRPKLQPSEVTGGLEKVQNSLLKSDQSPLPKSKQADIARALRNYIDFGAEMNSGFQLGHKFDRIDPKLYESLGGKDLDLLLSEMPGTLDEMTVYRWAHGKPGTRGGFTSTSADPAYVGDIGDVALTDKKRYKITVPQGTKAVSLAPYSWIPKEAEVLLPRQGQYRWLNDTEAVFEQRPVRVDEP